METKLDGLIETVKDLQPHEKRLTKIETKFKVMWSSAKFLTVTIVGLAIERGWHYLSGR
jgi:hypothetical protein